MGRERANSEVALAKIAARQHGVVSAAQLKAVGIADYGATRRVRAGRLHRVHRGVYAVGHPALTYEGRCMAAVLACSEGAVVSHRSAAALWRMLPPAPAPIEITLPTSAGRRKRLGIAIHRSRTLSPGATTIRSAIPVTRPARTLEDLRRVVPASAHQRAARRALDLRLVARTDLGPDPDLTRSELERKFLRLCRRRHLPEPEVNARVGPYEVDFLWRTRGVVVETDGFRHHRSRDAFEADRARDAELQARGYRVLRFTYRQLSESPEAAADRLRRLLGSG